MIIQSKFMRELGYHIRASYPFIYVVTEEHDRLYDEVEKLAETYLNKETKADSKFNVYRWTCTNHWMTKGKPLPVKQGEGDMPPNPLSDFAQIKDLNPFSIFVMENFHFYLTKESPDLIQLVKDLSRHCQQKNKCIIFANAIQEFPTELESSITVLNHELPGNEDIVTVMESVVDFLKTRNVDIKLTEEKRYATLEALKGMRLTDIENALAYSVVTTKTFDAKILLAEKCKAIKKSGTLEYLQSDISWDMIGGLERFKKWAALWKVVFTDKAKKFTLATPRGVMLLGVPGCGKSLVAMAMANYYGLPYLRFDPGSVFSKYVGDSEHITDKTLKIIDAVAPCVLHIDEFDKGMAGAGGSGEGDSGVSQRVYGKLLRWMSDHTSPVMVAATANDIMRIPAEYLRKGRFDEIFFFDIPNGTERRDIFKIQLNRQKLDPTKYDLDKFVDAAKSFTGAEIQAAVSMAKLLAANRGEYPSNEDIVTCVGEILPEAKKNKTKIETIRQRAAELAIPASYEEKADPTEVKAGGQTFRKVITD
jgi:ATP-dependent 26S proteasome regulatory subunit